MVRKDHDVVRRRFLTPRQGAGYFAPPAEVGGNGFTLAAASTALASLSGALSEAPLSAAFMAVALAAGILMSVAFTWLQRPQ